MLVFMYTSLSEPQEIMLVEVTSVERCRSRRVNINQLQIQIKT